MSSQSWGEVLVTSQSDGATLTAAAAASAIPAQAKYTLPANFFKKIGDKILVRGNGRLSTVATTPGTWRFDVRFGATIVFDTLAGAFNAATNAYTTVGFAFEFVLTARTIGSAASLMQGGWFTAPNIKGGADVAMPIGGVNALVPWNTAPAVGATFDSSISQQVDLFWTQTVATGSMTLHQYELVSLN